MQWPRLLCLLATLCSAVSLSPRAAAQRPLGIDVSHYQGTALDWPAIKNAGISFTWAKATEGTGYIDNVFVINAVNAKAAGVFFGGYHYAHPESNTSASEAAHYWAVAGPYIKGDGKSMMPMIDIEGTAFGGHVGATSLSDWINQWCVVISNNAFATGITIKPMIYISACNAHNLDTSVRPTTRPWIANYSGNNPQTSNPWTACASGAVWGAGVWNVWQYTDATTIPNHSGGVDGDVFNGTFAMLVDTLVIGGGLASLTQQRAT